MQNNLLNIILFGSTVGLIIYQIRKKRKQQTTKYRNIPENINWEQCYEPRFLLTKNEKEQFKKIITWDINKHYHIFTKVRLADLIQPRYGTDYQKLFWKIQAKHVDFVICDKNLNVKLIIELQDNSHTKENRITRDNFIKTILEGCGYKLLQTYNITEEQLNSNLKYQ